MHIGDAAKRSGVPAKTIRYYEEIGLVRPARRRANGYRDYDEEEVERLAFIRRARELGFNLDACRTLLALAHDPHRASADVKALARQHMQELDQRIAGLQVLRDTVARLAERCPGDAAPECPIMDDLMSGAHPGRGSGPEPRP